MENKKATANVTIRKIYSWGILSELRNGETVYMLDMLEVETKCLNDMTTGILMDLLNCIDAEKAEDRFIFWVVSETTEVQNEPDTV